MMRFTLDFVVSGTDAKTSTSTCAVLKSLSIKIAHTS